MTDFLSPARVPPVGAATFASACPLDCPDACSLEVTVEAGRVVRLDGDHRNPETQGFICGKVRGFHKRVYGPDRLLHPGVRDGRKGEGRFRRVSWDEALGRVAAKIEEVRARHGGEAILPFCYGGSNGLLTQDAVDARLFNRLGASRLARTVCAATAGRACSGLYGGMPGVGYQDYADARLIVLWGANPSISGVHLVPYVLEARRRGAKLVVVDPRRTPLARSADLHEEVRPPVSLLFVYNSNPLATLPNQRRVCAGLEREDLFTVVFDPVLTDTARYADVVLPATTFLEHSELRVGYGTPVLQRSRPAVSAWGEARPNHDVFLELCRRLSLSRPGDAETCDDFVRAAVSGLERAEQVLADLDSQGVAFPDHGLRPVQMVDLLPGTVDGRIHLCPEELDREAPDGLYRYPPPGDAADAGRHPLALLSPAGSRSICSTLGELGCSVPVLEIHPEDARFHGIGTGDPVRVYNEWGEVRAMARLSADLRPGVALLEKGMWTRDAPGGNTVNALIPDDLSDLAGGACFSDARVAVERIHGQGRWNLEKGDIL